VCVCACVALIKLDYQTRISSVLQQLKADRRLKLIIQPENARRPSFNISDTMVIKEIRCKLKKTSGKLYISNHHLAHFSKVFGLEKKVRMHTAFVNC
jgi:hypothetical protein